MGVFSDTTTFGDIFSNILHSKDYGQISFSKNVELEATNVYQ